MGQASKDPENNREDREFQQRVARRRAWQRRAERRKHQSIWMGMGMFGLVGWSVALPALAGLFLGHYLDLRLETGFSWTLALMLGGLTLGLFNVWSWMQKTSREEDEPEDEGA